MYYGIFQCNFQQTEAQTEKPIVKTSKQNGAQDRIRAAKDDDTRTGPKKKKQVTHMKETTGKTF